MLDIFNFFLNLLGKTYVPTKNATIFLRQLLQREGLKMILHHEFVKTAKKFSKKMAIIDKTTDKNVAYSKALIASIILAKKFKKYDERYIGVMIPTSAGCFLTNLGILMAGKVPAMINYSTGAAENCEYAQNKCGFKTIITSRALLEKINCRMVDGMICIEDIMKEISTGTNCQPLSNPNCLLKCCSILFPQPNPMMTW